LNSVWEIETIDKEQKRYTISDRCKLNNIFESLNHRRVVNLEISKIDKIDDDDLAKEILHGIESRISEKIMKSDYGAMKTDNPATNRCYIVEWSSNVYTVQDDIVIKGFNPPDYAYTGEIVCETRFWNPASKAKCWYTPIPEGEGDTTLRMKQVLMVNIKLVDISDNNKLPKGYNKKKDKRFRSVKNK